MVSKDMASREQSVAVVGCGVIGITSALSILERDPRVKVTVIADTFTPDNTTDGAAGLLMPHAAGDTPDHLIRKWFATTIKKFEEILQSGGASDLGIFEVQCTCYRTYDPSPEVPHWKDQVKGFHRMTKEELAENVAVPVKDGFSFSTIMAQGKCYMPWLMNRFCNLGGTLVKRKIHSLKELAADYDVIVNCTGLRAKELVNDPLVFPLRGQMLKVKAPWIKDLVTYRSEENERNERIVGILPQTNGEVWLAGTVQAGNYNPQPTVEDTLFILKSATSLSPSLKNAEILETWVGLRPARKEVRLEKEAMKFTDQGKNVTVNVVHNYGHGGSGPSLSFGCAEDCCDIVFECLSTLKPKSKL